ncbi:MAG: hypothetical protein Fur0042_02220 [Cyanophyceae cyanobacterium]
MLNSPWSPISIALLGCSAALVLAAPGQAQTPEQVAAQAEQITVAIASVDERILGSGVLIANESGVYYLLTANHVLQTQGIDYQVRTQDGRLHPITANTYQRLPGVDLAIAQFSSANTYAIATLGDSDRATIGTNIYVAGYPAPSPTIPIRTFQLPRGNITARPSTLGSGREGYDMVYDAVTRRGMSGGPVLNSEGQVIGIHGLADEDADDVSDPGKRGSGFNLATPIATFQRLAPQIYLQQGQDLLLAQDYAGARAAFRQGLRFDPNAGRVYGAMAYASLAAGNAEEAISFATRAISNGGTAADWRVRGAAYYQTGNRSRAISDLTQAINAEGRAIDHGLRGLAHARNQQVGEAIQDASRAIEKDPNNPVAYWLSAATRELAGDSRAAQLERDQGTQLGQQAINPFDLALLRGLQIEVPTASIANRPPGRLQPPSEIPENLRIPSDVPPSTFPNTPPQNPIAQPTPQPSPSVAPLPSAMAIAPSSQESAALAQAPAAAALLDVLTRQHRHRSTSTQFNGGITPRSAQGYNFSLRTTTRAMYYYALPENNQGVAYVGALFLEASSGQQSPTLFSILCQSTLPGRVRPADPTYRPPTVRCGGQTMQIYPAVAAPDTTVTPSANPSLAVRPTTPTNLPISLVDVCRSFQGTPHQISALETLQARIPSDLAVGFGSRWRTNVVLQARREPVDLLPACQYFQERPHQVQALEWLQVELAQQDPAALNTFAQQWRRP